MTLRLCDYIPTAVATQRVADSVRCVINPGQPARAVIEGIPDSARTVADSFDGSTDSIDEDADPAQSAGHACHSVVESIHEDIDAVQKIVEAGQRVHCMKRLRHPIF